MSMFSDAFLTATLLTTMAGLSTTVGSLVAVFYREPGPRYMALALGFSAGVMIHVSYVELLNGSMGRLAEGGMGADEAFALAHLALFAGFVLMLIIDVFVSHSYIMETGEKEAEMQRMGLLVALGVAIHNFPEGMATFGATLQDPSVGLAVAIAVAIHNIPEGVAVAVPIYRATGSARKAFTWSFLSGVTEPLGAILAGLLLMPALSIPWVLPCTLCLVAGFMIYIAFDELLPVAHSYGQEHVAILGVLAGMAVMALSLGLL
ncbi:MAG: zinc transporter ZupT [Candidatus Brocadiia bacterium]